MAYCLRVRTKPNKNNEYILFSIYRLSDSIKPDSQVFFSV